MHRASRSRLVSALALALAASARAGAPAEAQVPPNAAWRTIETPHFRVTFAPELEVMARRAAAHAEDAYAALSRHLRPPRGTIDIVVSDNYDISNGYATAFPSNRIVLYANPPITSAALRFVDDPTKLIITHELVHVFHLDRAAGIWGLAQKVFGRSPYLFPNAYQPSWLLEGLAVHYETLLTGSGRLAGSGHRMIARTASMSHALPRLDQLSSANPRFPYAYSAYAYGSLFVEHLGRAHGDSALRRFVESSSRNLIPMWLEWPARRAFRRTLTRAYSEWSRSLRDSAPPHAPEMPGWRDLTTHGAYASFPRWLDDSTLLYTGTSGRETFGLYQLSLRPSDRDDAAAITRRRLARRHSSSPNTMLADGSILYSQQEFRGPWHLRSDLYVDRPGGGTVRLTRDARLSMPHARRDGLVVAMQTVPGATRLALVSPDGRRVVPITATSLAGRDDALDVHWAEPRWSPDGRHIAAVRWTTGGTSELVVLDTAGSVRAALFGARAAVATPSWSSDGRWVYFSSDHAGITNLYRASFDAGAGPPVEVQRLSDARTGLFEPEPAPSDRAMAAVVFRADGYHVGMAPLAAQADLPVDSAVRVAPSAPATAEGPARNYSAWRSLLPRYWLPFIEPALTKGSRRYGAHTSGQDLVGRHAYQALLYVPNDNSGLTGSFYYRNARLGQPLVELGAAQDWQNFRCLVDPAQPTQCVGTLRRRIRDASLGLLFQRPRMRTFSYLGVGAGVEVRDYATDPAPLLSQLNAVLRDAHAYPRLTLSAGWSNTQFPPLAISAEDGVTLAGTSRMRWRTGDTLAATVSVVGTASAFKSLDLPGFGHHVAALRVAGGALDNRGTGYLEVGGVSGGTLDVLPGYAVGEGRRTFGVRGFPAASLLGIRAMAASAEYRAPLLLPGRGLGTLPLFLDRTSVTVFGDAATAWCPVIAPSRPIPDTALCTQAHYDIGRTVAVGQQPLVHLDPRFIASAGAELNVNAAVLSWDAPFRYRLGVAVPVAGKELVGGVKPATFYFAVGASF